MMPNTSLIVLLLALLSLVSVASRDLLANKICQKLVGISKNLYLCPALCVENMKTCMKKLYILLLAAMAWGPAMAQDNAFYFTDSALMPGTTTNIELCMRNTATNLTCLEAEIQLPEGILMVLDEGGNPIVTPYPGRSAKHEVLANVLDNGNLKLLISSIEANLFNEGEGPLLSFRVEADEEILPGEYQVETVGESLLVNTAAEASYSVGTTGNVLVTDDATPIVSPVGDKDEGTAVYNLSGQRVVKAKGGIFIKNGRKELHK